MSNHHERFSRSIEWLGDVTDTAMTLIVVLLCVAAVFVTQILKW